MKISGLALKIVAGYLLLAIFITGVLSISFYILARGFLVNQARTALHQDAETLARLLATSPFRTEKLVRPLKEQIALRLASRLISGHYVVVDAQERIIASDWEERFPAGSQLKLPLSGQRQPKNTQDGIITRRDREFIFTTAPVPDATGRKVIVLAPLSSLQLLRERLFMMLLRSLFWTIPLAVFVAFLLGRHISRPLGLLQERIQQAARRQFGQPVEIRTGDEIEELSRNFNFMIQQLTEYDNVQRRFFQNASHELKTPLMNIQGYAEGIKDGIFTGAEADHGLTVISRESQRLKGIIDEMIYLTRLESTVEIYSFGRVNLVSILQETIESLRPTALEKGIEITLDTTPELWLQGDVEKLFRLCLNIAGNAVHHAFSSVSLSIYPSVEKGLVTLLCRDDGEGFSEEQLRRPFERFRKGPGGSTGLGLVIAQAIARAHGGRVTISNAAGGGAEVEVSLPLRT